MPSTNKRAAPVTSPHFSAPSSTSEPPSKKRRMPGAQAEQKYYAVRVGRKPGVYLNWVDCQKQIVGHSGATFKSFTDRAHAAAFVAGRPIPASASAPQPIRYYGVAVGRETGVFTDWSTVQELITGWKLPKYQKFETRAEAEAFVRREGRNAGNKPAVAKDKPTKTAEEKARPTVQARKTVPVKEEEDTSAAAPTATARTTALVKKDISSVEDRKTAVVPAPTIVYSDGSSLNNGKANARAGVGVFFGPGDPRNVSERLKGPLQTNQRAELTGVLRTLQAIPMTEPLTIRTDSMYSINCVTLWSKKWEKNEWCTAAGEVKNKDLVQAIREIYDARLRLGTATNFEWVKGHSGHPGNEAADRLANAGALMPEAEDDGSL